VQIETEAIVCAVRSHAEHGAVVRLLTSEHGLQAAYVRGARSRRLRPVLLPGNAVQARLRSRTEEQLAHGEVELTHSRATLLSEPLPAAAVEWVTALSAAALPEAHPYPRLYQALDGLLAAIEAAPSALGWAASLVRYELLLLAELGFGLDLDRVPSAPALPVPQFLRVGGQASWSEIIDGLHLTGYYLGRDVLTGRSAAIGAARVRLVDRLARAGGFI
jgi:DNA repair protein RecO (recombination protein O)